MVKLLIIMFLLTMCALLEVPEDYQLSSNATHVAVLNAQGTARPAAS